MKTHSNDSISLALAALVNLLLLQSSQAGVWTTNSPMSTGRLFHTGTLLPDGKVLVAGGEGTNASAVSSAELFNPATGTWTKTGALATARYSHTATLLTDGLVLVAGGICTNSFTSISSAELFNPATGTWTNTSAMHDARRFFTATLLPCGKVLVAGGIGNGVYLDSAELFDPASGTWTETGEMNTARNGHTATLLPDGTVLVTGGVGQSGVLSSVEIYDPSNETWTVTNSLLTARVNHSATLLPDGDVLIAGGYNLSSGSLNGAELYHPASGTWKIAATMNTRRRDAVATLLPDGDVLVEGGVNPTDGSVIGAETYNPISDTWTTNGPMNEARDSQTATLLANGKVLVAGGDGGAYTGTETFDPAINPPTGTWTNTEAMDAQRSYHTATLLPDGQVLVAGGGGDAASAETYNPADGTWTNVGALNAARGGHTATLLPNGQVLVAGGFESAGVNIAVLASAEVYEPSNETWRLTGPMTTARAYHTATLLPNGKVLVAGGQGTDNAFVHSAEIYNPASETWSSVASMTTNRAWHTATLLADGKVLVAGGVHGATTNFGTLDSAELFDPASGTWTTTGAMTVPRAYYTATLLPNGEVLAAGGNDLVSTSPTGAAGMIWSSAELFNPATGSWTVTGFLSMYRDYHTATLLPDGKVLVVGNETYITGSELFDPATGTWSAAGDMSVARFNHTATLLPDGTVLIAGGMYPGGGDYYSSAELYDAGLGYSNSWQPQITMLTSPINPGSGLVVTGAQFRGIAEGSGGNTQVSAADYPLVQLRSIESGQSMFLLTTNWSTNSFVSTAVWNFPPGWALATVFVNGIQSTSAIVNISVPVPTMTSLTGAALAGGALQFTFTNSPGALFGVLATTNLSLRLNNWTILGGVTEIAPGQFQFTDPQTTNGGQRFYRLYAP